MRVLGLFRSDRADRDLSEELESHLQHHIDDNLRAGMPPDAARRSALIALGGLEQTKEQYRDRRGLVPIEQFVYDIRMAVRALARRRLMLAAAVTSIAIGVGANVAVYTALKYLLLSPRWLVASDPDRLITVAPGLSYLNFLDMQRSDRSVELAAFTMSRVVWRSAELSASVSVHAVSENFFEMLGTRAVRGRLFGTSTPDRPDDPYRVLLGYDFWRRLGASEAIVGQPVTINGWAYSIVGVLPPEFHLAVGPMLSSGIYIPISAAVTTALDRRDASYFDIVGRLRSGVTFPQAVDSLKQTASDLESRFVENRDLVRRLTIRSGAVSPIQAMLAAPQGRVVMTLAAVAYGLVGLVLLIACANVAGLLTARADERRHETAVRTALGASRARLIQQFLAESLIVAVLGIAAATSVWMVLAAVLPRFAVFDPSTQFVPERVPLLYSAALAIVVTIACGLAPAMTSTRVAPVAGLKAGRLGHVVRGLRLQNILVGAQVAFSFVLLSAAFVLLHAFVLLRVVDPGYDVVHTAAVQLLPVTTAPVPATRLRSVVGSLAGVDLATYGELPLGGLGILSRSTRVHTAGAEPAMTTELHFAGPRFLETMGIPLERGRDLNEQDLDAGGNAAGTVVNETFARRYFGARDPIGSEIVLEGDAENGRPDRHLQIVGVARDTKTRSLADDGTPVLYLARQSLTVVVRLRDAAASQARAIERAVEERFPGSLVSVRPMSTAFSNALLPSRLAAALLSALGAIGLTLAMIGLHGIVSYGVTRRLFEIGVRMALGATRVSIVKLILRSATRVVAVGAAIGAVASLVVLQALRPFLAIGQSTVDPVAIAGVGVTLIAAGAAASLWPARRAASVDPTAALRSE